MAGVKMPYLKFAVAVTFCAFVLGLSVAAGYAAYNAHTERAATALGFASFLLFCIGGTCMVETVHAEWK